MKYLLAAQILVLLCALTSVCVLGILYHKEIYSNAMLSKKYANVTAMMKMQELKALEKEKLSAVWKWKYQLVHELLIACNASENCEICEEGWKALGLKCYNFSTVKLNWTQSRDYCVEKGGHLVIITNQTEQDFVVSQIRVTHWIGLNDLETEGQWMWVNNQPLNETGVTFWYSAPGTHYEPDNWKEKDPSGENCAALGDIHGNIHRWFDGSCHLMKKWICEK